MSTIDLKLERDQAVLARDQALYFDMLAEMGHTKHIGGLAATLRLIEIIAPQPGDVVLDVGCGVGIAATFLAERYGCDVVGIDITPRMLERAQERAKRKGVSDKTEFRTADMHALPYENGRFDAAIAESVLCFSQSRSQVLAEMMRVVKPGGHVAFTEATWRKPPPEDVARQMASALGLPDGVVSHSEWDSLITGASLEDVVAEEHPVTFRQEAKNQSGRIGFADYMRTFGRFFKLLGKAEYRAIYRTAMARTPAAYYQYIGYGVYGGKKPV
jgi:arsenite methyltransferase